MSETRGTTIATRGSANAPRGATIATRGTTIALVGNPNCGKTTVFNALTGHHHRVGNWPGVTVERKEGELKLGNEKVRVVDLPGIYALLASSEDERVARDYILSGEPGLVIDIVDATNLERNLYLTTQLLDMKVPLVVVLTMMDLAEKQGIAVDAQALSEQLGCPVIGVTATDRRDVRRIDGTLEQAWKARRPAETHVPQLPAVEELAETWAARLQETAARLGTNGRWLALKLLERDGWATRRVTETEVMDRDEIERQTVALEDAVGESADIALAESRYSFIEAVTGKALRRPPMHETGSDRADRVLINRFLGIPIFLLAMWVLFWFTINVGGAFIDFFDIAAGTIFVDGVGRLLEAIGSPDWLITILASGVGAGIQTVATFIPVVFAMFFGLSLLEDSGYMARAAFVMDRFMRWVGLPGKSFVPMLVGFGCNVPAIMATRTLETRRDRYMTIFMNPFMSCGARLPVYALFGAAFFGAAAGAMTFSLYFVGIAAAILTGLLLKKTMFKGEASYFVMELPPYHVPRLGRSTRHSWRRTVVFMTRAKYIVPIVAVLAVLNSVGTDGTFGNEDSSTSVLSSVGQTITPVFEPMGVEEDNWPATVGVFTGIFAKEAVIGTLNSLYSQDAAAADGKAAAAGEPSVSAEDGFSFWGGIGDAFRSIPDALAGAPAALIDPFGFGLISDEKDTVAEEVGAGSSVYAGLQAGFSQGAPQAYAYLLFILLYPPCVAAFGAMTREMGLRYTMLSVVYLLVVAWSVATLFYQIALGREALWIMVSLALLGLTALMFWVIGRRSQPDELQLPALTPATGSAACGK